MDIQDKLEPAELEDIDMTITLVDKTLRNPMRFVKNSSINIGSHIPPIDFVVVDMPSDYFFQICLVEPF
jgi:hypothetical protein